MLGAGRALSTPLEKPPRGSAAHLWFRRSQRAGGGAQETSAPKTNRPGKTGCSTCGGGERGRVDGATPWHRQDPRTCSLLGNNQCPALESISSWHPSIPLASGKCFSQPSPTTRLGDAQGVWWKEETNGSRGGTRDAAAHGTPKPPPKTTSPRPALPPGLLLLPGTASETRTPPARVLPALGRSRDGGQEAEGLREAWGGSEQPLGTHGTPGAPSPVAPARAKLPRSGTKTQAAGGGGHPAGSPRSPKPPPGEGKLESTTAPAPEPRCRFPRRNGSRNHNYRRAGVIAPLSVGSALSCAAPPCLAPPGRAGEPAGCSL